MFVSDDFIRIASRHGERGNSDRIVALSMESGNGTDWAWQFWMERNWLYIALAALYAFLCQHGFRLNHEAMWFIWSGNMKDTHQSFFETWIQLNKAHVLTAHTTYILCHTVYTIFIYITSALITIIAAHVLTVHTTYILCHTVYILFIYICITIMHVLCTLLLCTSGWMLNCISLSQYLYSVQWQ